MKKALARAFKWQPQIFEIERAQGGQALSHS